MPDSSTRRPTGVGSPYSRRAVHICWGFDPKAWKKRRPRADRSAEGCAGHTPCPSGFIQRGEWAEWMLETHHPVRCPECGLWAIWVPGAEDLDEGSDEPLELTITDGATGEKLT